MTMLRLLRCSAVILLCVGMAACARMPSEPPPDSRQAEPAAETGEAPRSGGEAVQAIGIGEAALAERRGALVESGRAIGPDALGYFMDVHEARLLQSLGDSIRMRRDGHTFRLLVAGRASFNTGSSRLRDFLLDDLRSLAEVLIEFDNTLVAIHTHTDSRGDTGFNRALSERRAMRVAESLAEYGVEPARLVAVGHGERDPVADNQTVSGRAKNRRLEIVIETMVQSVPE